MGGLDGWFFFFFFQAEDGIRDAQESRGLGDVYKRQRQCCSTSLEFKVLCVVALRRPFMEEGIRRQVLALLDQHRIMTVATVRPDGWPQATTVGYVNEGLTLYFLCALDSQKARNLAQDDRISLTIDHDTADPMAITGLSMAARAHRVDDRAEAEKVLRMLPLK